MRQYLTLKTLSLVGASVAVLCVGLGVYVRSAARNSAASVSSAECITPADVDCLAGLAARLAPLVSNPYTLAYISTDLARAGKIPEAEQIAGRIADPVNRDSAEEAIAVFKSELAIRANAPDNDILAPIEQLGTSTNSKLPPLVRVSGAYYILGLELLGQHPFSNGGSGFIVEPERSLYERSIPPVSHPITLVVTRLGALAPNVPKGFQGTVWIHLAELLIHTGDRAAAADALVNAAHGGGSPQGLIARWWLKLGNYDAALATVEGEKNPHLAAGDYAAVAEAEVTNGMSGASVDDFLRKAIQAAKAGVPGRPNFELVRKEIGLELKTGKAADAKTEAADMLGLARASAPLFKARDLSTVAAMYIDIGQVDAAKPILREATDAIPRDNYMVLGVSLATGPTTCTSFHWCDGMRAAIAAQDYRVGDTENFDKVMASIPSDFRPQAWAGTLEENVPDRLPAPIISKAETELSKNSQLGLLTELAGLELSHGNPALAATILEGLKLSDAGNTLPDFGLMQGAARLSIVLNRPDLARKQFVAMVAVADAMTNVTDKARAYAAAAAFRRKFIGT